MERLLTTEEVAEYLRVDVVTVRRLVNRGELIAYRIGSEYRFSEDDIERFVRQQRVGGSDELEEGEPASWVGKMVTNVRGKDRDRFDKFTERARRVLSLAQEEAQRFQHNYVGTEHLLLGLVGVIDGVAGRILSNLGVNLDRARAQVESIIGRGDRMALGEVGLTPRAKKVIELAVDEARRMNHHYIGTEHLLLGMMREGEGIASAMLESMGVRLDMLRKQTIQVMKQMQEARATMTPDDKPEGGERLFPQEPGRFDRFTGQARQVLNFATEEAQQFQHNYVGTEHLLLGLLREGGGIAGRVLRTKDVTVEKTRKAIDFIVGRGKEAVMPPIGLTPRAKHVIELAVDEARQLNHHYIGTEHILLGLMREGEGIGARILPNMGVSLDGTRNQILKMLSHAQAAGAAAPPPAPEAPPAPETPEEAPPAPETPEEVPPAPPPVPDEAATLLPEGEAGRTCSKCGAHSPNYFNHCFNCGEKL